MNEWLSGHKYGIFLIKVNLIPRPSLACCLGRFNHGPTLPTKSNKKTNHTQFQRGLWRTNVVCIYICTTCALMTCTPTFQICRLTFKIKQQAAAGRRSERRRGVDVVQTSRTENDTKIFRRKQIFWHP